MRISSAQAASRHKTFPVLPVKGHKRCADWESDFFKYRRKRQKQSRKGMAELFWNTVKKPACKKMKTEKRLLFHPGAPIWAASWSGIPTNKAGTAPVTDPGLTGREICWKGLPKPASPILKKALLDIAFHHFLFRMPGTDQKQPKKYLKTGFFCAFVIECVYEMAGQKAK